MQTNANPEDDAQTIGDALRVATERLRARDRDGARRDAALLLAHAVRHDAAWLLAHDDARLAEADRTTFERAVARRERGEPIAYVLGRHGFYGREFAVDPAVLVPRPETEAIVEAALAHAARCSRAPRFCDVGTGSGALALTLACERGDAEVTAIDVSAAALAVAERNARALAVRERVAFVLGDGVRAATAAAPFTCIVANLPYVRRAELACAPDPTSFEPRVALDGGPDGLDAYRALVRDAPALLGDAGLLVMEAGPDTVAPLAALARRAFSRARISTTTDLAGLARLVVVET